MGTNVPVRLNINITLTTLYKNKNLCVELLCHLSEIPLVPNVKIMLPGKGGKGRKLITL